MWLKVFLLFFVLSFLIRTDHSFDQDLGRHIKTGEIIVNTLSVPKVNLFSYTNPDFPFINTHWFFGVIAHFFNITVGLQALLILKVVIFLLSLWMIFSLIEKKFYPLFLPISFIFLHVLRERLELRPEIFSFLFASLILTILFKYKEHFTKLIFALPLVQLAWINTHIYFFVGFLIQTIFLIHFGIKKEWGKLKRLSFITAASMLISILNPNGISGLFYPLNVNKNYGYAIVENQNLFFLEKINFRDPNFLFVKLSIILVAVSLLFSLIRKNFSIINNLLALSGVILALMYVRSFPYLVFLSLVPTIKNFGVTKVTPLTQLLTYILALILIIESVLYLNGSYYRHTDSDNKVELRYEESVKGAMDFVISHKLEGPIFNNFDIGSYIIYRGYPEYQVFVDGRPEAYPAQFLQEVYVPAQADYFVKFKQMENEYKFKSIIFSHTDQTPWGQNFLKNVVSDPEWKVVYLDGFMIVLTKKSANIDSLDLVNLTADKYQFGNALSYLRMGIFLLNNSFTQAGFTFVDQALKLNPDSPSANSIMASLLSSSPNFTFSPELLMMSKKSSNFYFW